MRILLTSEQLKFVSDFFGDVAKGLTLAAVLGQSFANIESIYTRTFGSLIILGLSFVFLYAGVLLRKK